MELEVILEAQPCSEVGQAAELIRGRGQAAGYYPVWTGPEGTLLSPYPPQKKGFKKELEMCVRETCSSTELRRQVGKRGWRQIVLREANVVNSQRGTGCGGTCL